MDDKITVLIADDQELVRSGYKAILGTYPEIEVVGVVNDGAEAIQAAQTLKPDVVMMDIRMPNKDGIQATRDITQNPTLSNVHVLVLTTFDIDQYVYDALSAGASGFLLKDADPDEIVNAIKIVAQGDALIEPSVMKRLVETFVSNNPAVSSAPRSKEYAQALKDLTDRELEILKLVAQGLTNDDIAEKLFISPATVKTHVARIMAKTDAHDRAQLVVFAYESGMLHENYKAK